MRKAKLGDFLAKRSRGIVPASTPDETFELYSVPAFESKRPEVVTGGQIGSNKQIVDPGTVLLCKINPRINRAWTVGSFTKHQKIASTEWITFPPHPDLEPRYLAHYLRRKEIRDYLAANASGVGGSLMRVKASTVEDLPFALPDVDEQRRTVAELDKQFSRLDGGVANLKHVKANLKRYKAAVLRAAIDGHLVPTEAEVARRVGHDYEAATVLLKRTTPPARPNRYSSRSSDVILGHAALSVGNTGGAIPEGWAWAALVDIARMESGHTPSRNHPEWWSGDVPWLGIVDAREHHGGVINDTSQHTNDAGLENSAARVLPAGTVCVSRTASVGYVVVLGRPMATSQDFVNWTPTGAVTSDWLRIVFLADREALLRFGKGSVHKTIYFPEWLAVHIAVPPLAEQQRIAKEVDRRLSIVSAAEAEADRHLGRASRLREALLARAFGSGLNIDTQDHGATLGAQEMTRPKLPALPPDRGTDADDVRLDLADVLTKYPDGIEPEALFRAAGYKGDQIDDFYRGLDAIREQVSIAGGDAVPRNWPAKTVVRLAPRKS